MAVVVPRDQALKMPTRHNFVPGMGYVYIDAPTMKIPPINPPVRCTPNAEVPNGTLVEVASPNNIQTKFIWDRVNRLLFPITPYSANRLAFTPEYLASHGWSIK